MRILVTGSGGQLGASLVSVAVRKHDVHSMFKSRLPPAGIPHRADLLDPGRVGDLTRSVSPDIIVHTAALTDVDLCEKERQLATRVNFRATKNLAGLARELGAFMVYVSTDYVFDGEAGLYKESDEASPVNYYGETKLMGEKAVQDSGCAFSIVRSSAIYGARQASGKPNFALWLIDNLKRGKEAGVLRDQIVSPTECGNLAEMILEIAERSLTGVLNLAGSTRASRLEFAKAVVARLKLDDSLIVSRTILDMKWLARRPRDSSLDTSRALGLLSHKPLNLAESLARFVRELDAPRYRE